MIKVLSVRHFRGNELPHILRRGVETSLAQLVPREIPGATVSGVAAQLHRMYELALQHPKATVLVVDWPAGAAADDFAPGTGPAAYTLLLPQPNVFTGEPELMVMDIFTHPYLRGRGIGKELLAAAARYAGAVGCRSLAAQVALHNESSMRLFRACGFQEERLLLGWRL